MAKRGPVYIGPNVVDMLSWIQREIEDAERRGKGSPMPETTRSAVVDAARSASPLLERLAEIRDAVSIRRVAEALVEVGRGNSSGAMALLGAVECDVRGRE